MKFTGDELDKFRPLGTYRRINTRGWLANNLANCQNTPEGLIRWATFGAIGST